MKTETRKIIKKWLLGWIGNRPTHEITKAADGWFKAGLFTEEDVAEINAVVYGGEEPTEAE